MKGHGAHVIGQEEKAYHVSNNGYVINIRTEIEFMDNVLT